VEDALLVFQLTLRIKLELVCSKLYELSLRFRLGVLVGFSVLEEPTSL